MNLTTLASNLPALLNTGSYQSAEIDRYFDLNGLFAKNEVCKRMIEIYKEGCRLFPNSNDEVFFYILNQIDGLENRQRQDAALVLMAYYFETCDIF